MADNVVDRSEPVSENWRGWSDVQLAKSWVTFNLKEIETKRKSIESQRNVKPYEPKPVVRPANIEPGSMDANDWLVAANDPDIYESDEHFDPDLELIYLDHEATPFEEDLRILNGDEGTDEDRAWLAYGHANHERLRREKLEASTKPIES